MSTLLTAEMNHLPPALTQRSGSCTPREAASANGSAAEPLRLHTGGDPPKTPREGAGDSGRRGPLHRCVSESDPVCR